MAFVYCEECGREVSDKARFCPQCGCTFRINGRGLAITSMVLGIVACTCCLITILFALSNAIAAFSFGFDHALTISVSSVTFVLAALSLIFAIISKIKGSKLKKTCAGLTLGTISIIISLICLIINIIFAV